MRLLYDLFFIIFAVFYIPVLLLRGKFHKGFMQKFGILPAKVKGIKKCVWIHAVSVGEAAVAAKLSIELKKKNAGMPIVISTTTPTGNDMIRKLEKGTTDLIFYYPFDLSFIIKKVIKLIDPAVYVMIETELWPNALEEFSRKGIPVVLANGRISDSSFKNYRKVAAITKRMFKQISVYCMQSEKDAQRVCALGGVRDRVSIIGNMKFQEDLSFAEKETEDAINKDYQIIVAGSTHYPEEHMLIDMYRELKNTNEKLKLILVPRHIERKDAIGIYLDKSNLKYSLYSEAGESLASSDVLLVDTIGHLKDLYRLATLVYVGGSMVKKGGQNPIEPAIWGKPIIFGPHMYNFREVVSIFLENNAAIQVRDENELKQKIKYLFESPQDRETLAKNAKQVILKNSGAVDRTVEKIMKLISGGM